MSFVYKMEEEATKFFVRIGLVGIVLLIVLFVSVMIGADFRFLLIVLVVGVSASVINSFRGKRDAYE